MLSLLHGGRVVIGHYVAGNSGKMSVWYRHAVHSQATSVSRNTVVAGIRRWLRLSIEYGLPSLLPVIVVVCQAADIRRRRSLRRERERIGSHAGEARCFIVVIMALTVTLRRRMASH